MERISDEVKAPAIRSALQARTIADNASRPETLMTFNWNPFVFNAASASAISLPDSGPSATASTSSLWDSRRSVRGCASRSSYSKSGSTGSTGACQRHPDKKINDIGRKDFIIAVYMQSVPEPAAGKPERLRTILCREPFSCSGTPMFLSSIVKPPPDSKFPQSCRPSKNRTCFPSADKTAVPAFARMIFRNQCRRSSSAENAGCQKITDQIRRRKYHHIRSHNGQCCGHPQTVPRKAEPLPHDTEGAAP